MGSFQITIDACAGCCDEPLLVVGDCESLTGTATLCGFSAYSADASPYDPLAPDDWEGQYRKWRDRTLAGSLYHYVGACLPPECTAGDNSGTTFSHDYSGTAQIECDSTTQATDDRTQTDASGVNCNTQPPFNQSVLEINQDGGYTIATGSCPATGPSFYETHTLLLRTVTGCGCQSDGFAGKHFTDGTATETLSEERYLYDALSEKLASEGPSSGVTEGSECCTDLTAADQTTPESLVAIEMTGTAVRIPLMVTNCPTVGQVFTVYVTLSQGGEEFVVDIGVECDVQGYFYVPLPAPDEEPICFVSASF